MEIEIDGKVIGFEVIRERTCYSINLVLYPHI